MVGGLESGELGSVELRFGGVGSSKELESWQLELLGSGVLGSVELGSEELE